MKNQTLKLNDRRYHIIFATLKEISDACGDERPAVGCCTDPSEKKQFIMIHKYAESKIKMHTVIHEGLHALLWDIKHSKIEYISSEIADNAWEEGYRIRKSKKIIDTKLERMIFTMLNKRLNDIKDEKMMEVADGIRRLLNVVGFRAKK